MKVSSTCAESTSFKRSYLDCSINYFAFSLTPRLGGWNHDEASTKVWWRNSKIRAHGHARFFFLNFKLMIDPWLHFYGTNAQFCDFILFTGLRFNDQVFDVVLDKACLDCMVCTDSDAQAREYINLTLSEANRVLKSGGYYILVSSGINRYAFILLVKLFTLFLIVVSGRDLNRLVWSDLDGRWLPATSLRLKAKTSMFNSSLPKSRPKSPFLIWLS